MSAAVYPLHTILEKLGGPPSALGSTAGLEPQPTTPQHRALLKASQAFEAVFLTQLLGSMRRTVPETGFFGGNSRPMKIFKAMQDEEVAKAMASSGGIGLAAMLYNQMAKSIPSTQSGRSGI